MLHYPMKLVALTALTAAIGAAPAVAGGPSCCSCAVGCPPLVEIAPFITTPFYLVDQGPTYTGPGIVRVPGYIEVDTAPATYPYVGRDYDFPRYPYVRHHRRHHWR